MKGRYRGRSLVAIAVLGATVVAAAEAQGPPAPAEVHHIHGLAVDRRNPEIVYVATHTGLVRLQPDGAPEWVGSHRFDLMGFTADPRDPHVVYASGHPDLPTYRQEGVGNLGLLVSRDGGRTWQAVALKGDADFHALTYTPRDGGQLYGWSAAGLTGLHRISVATWKAERLAARGLSSVTSLAASPDPAGPLLAGTTTGLLRSRDGGGTWERVAAIPAEAPVFAVGYHLSDARVVYAYVRRSDLGLVRSGDGGATWERTGLAFDAETPVVVLAVGPASHVVVATARADVLRSRDGGRTWQPMLERGRPVAGGR